MNIRTSAVSYMHFNEAASGQGTAGGGSEAAVSGSVAPAAAPAGGEAAPSEGGGNNSSPVDAFSGMDNEDWGLDVVEVPAEPATGTEPGAAPAGEPKVVPPVAPVAPAAPAAPAAAAPAPLAANEASSPRSPLDEAIEGFKANKAPLTDWAAGEIFKLSPEDQAALDTDASATIPKLMARTYVEGLVAAKNLIRNFVPQMIASEVAKISATQKRSSEAMDQFYGEHKELNPQTHGPAVQKWLSAFRANNPKASRKEAIDFVGRAVKLEAGIAPGAVAAPRAAPFAPARQGGRAPANNSLPNDPYAGLDQDFDEVE